MRLLDAKTCAATVQGQASLQNKNETPSENEG